MQLCPNGHQLPEYADGYCARCAQDSRNSWQRGNPKKFDPGRYLGKTKRPGGSSPSGRYELPPDKRMPDFSRLDKPKPIPAPKPAVVHKAKIKRTPPPTTPPASPTPVKPKPAPSFSPKRVLEGVENLLNLVNMKQETLDSLLVLAGISPQMQATFRDGRHAFVRDLRERWFALFKTMLINEEARVIVRKVGLDGLTAPTTMNELAERCQMSVEEMRRHGGNGLRKLRDFDNRRAVMACIIDSARLLLR